MNDSPVEIEVPFQYRHCCWFCGEPAGKTFSFPNGSKLLTRCCHEPLSVPCCRECYQGAQRSIKSSIWLIASDVKKFLIKKYKKHLSIGLNWTEEELNNSQFEGGNFESFQRSAWLMYEIAQTRVNFSPWAIIFNGINIEYLREDEVDTFEFDGVEYPSLEEAITHYVAAFNLSDEFFRQVLNKLGSEKFSVAIRLCRLMVGSSAAECRQTLKEL